MTFHLMRSSGTLGLDLRGELPRDVPLLDGERDRAVVLLGDAAHPEHEVRPVLELGPLVVGRLQRHRHVHGLLDGHAPVLAYTGHAATSTATATATEGAAHGLLGDAAEATGFLDLAVDAVLELLAHTLAGLGAGVAQRILRALGGSSAGEQLLDRAGALDGERDERSQPCASCHTLHAAQVRTRALRLLSSVSHALGDFLHYLS
ncbi:MAG: hypothetical protein WKF40_01215 [Thermoleophilaceae bacterium]